MKIVTIVDKVSENKAIKTYNTLCKHNVDKMNALDNLWKRDRA